MSQNCDTLRVVTQRTKHCRETAESDGYACLGVVSMISLFYINNVEFYFKHTIPNHALVSNAGLGILSKKLQ